MSLFGEKPSLGMFGDTSMHREANRARARAIWREAWNVSAGVDTLIFTIKFASPESRERILLRELSIIQTAAEFILEDLENL